LDTKRLALLASVALLVMLDWATPSAWAAGALLAIPVLIALLQSEIRLGAAIIAVAIGSIGLKLIATDPLGGSQIASAAVQITVILLAAVASLRSTAHNMRAGDLLSRVNPSREHPGHEAHMAALEAHHHTIEQQITSLKLSNRELDRFAYIAAHDLQEPLRTVSSFSNLLADALPDLTGEPAQFLELIQSNAVRGEGLVKDLLAYARLNGDWQPEWLDLNTLLQEVSCTIRKDNTKAVITLADMPRILGNAGQLRQAFTHLVDNGVKFNKHDRPRVDVGVEEDDQHWRFNVKDNGIGMDVTMHERIFEIFTRLNNRDDFAGTGIGLAICRRVMDLHHGAIAVTQSTPQGSVVTCTLPKNIAATRDR